MSETPASQRQLSLLNNHVPTVLLATFLAVMVIMSAAIILLTVGVGTYRGGPPHHSMGMLVTGSVAGKRQNLRTGSTARTALPTQPVAAARDLVHRVVGIQLPCYPNNVRQWYLASLGCPVTSQYRRYLLAHMRDVDPICQCQNYAIRNTFHLLYQQAGLAVVSATLTFYYNKVYIVFVEVNRPAGWMVTANYVTHR